MNKRAYGRLINAARFTVGGSYIGEVTPTEAVTFMRSAVPRRRPMRREGVLHLKRRTI